MLLSGLPWEASGMGRHWQVARIDGDHLIWLHLADLTYTITTDYRDGLFHLWEKLDGLSAQCVLFHLTEKTENKDDQSIHGVEAAHG